MKTKHLQRILFLMIVLVTLFTFTVAASDLINPEVIAENAIVASAHPLASQAGIEMLQKGGNAVDAAVATAFAIGVVEPNATGLGGEGMMLIYLAETGQSIAIDYRSCAPKAIDQYDWKQYGMKSIAIPGTVAGLTMALEKYGTLSLAEVMAPAIRYAEEGFIVSPTLEQVINDNYEKLLNDPAGSQIFLEEMFPKKSGDLLKQTDLATTLRKIAKGGADVFYNGEIADTIATEMAKSGGLITKEDMANYRAVERKPVVGEYRDCTVISTPPPVSGMTVVGALQIMNNFDLKQYGHMSYETLHIMSEAVRLAYKDRYSYMADPDFVDVPLDILLDPDYAAKRASLIDMSRQIPKAELPAGDLDEVAKEHHSTTHLVVADKNGNMVSLTQTISSFFGSGYVVPGLGIVMNNEMYNFSKTGINKIEPYKRMRTTIAPTILLRDGKPFMTIGTPGAARIVPTIVNIISNVVDFDMGLQEAIEAPRFYSTSQDEKVYLEGGIPELVQKGLEKKGYQLELKGTLDLFFGGAQGAMYDLTTGKIIGAADPRRDGTALGF